jgi:hypothetical protein
MHALTVRISNAISGYLDVLMLPDVPVEKTSHAATLANTKRRVPSYPASITDPGTLCKLQPRGSTVGNPKR